MNPETREYAVNAVEHGYRVEIAEPDSPWWEELRVLPKCKPYVESDLFDAWAEQLAGATGATHRVRGSTIRHWMSCWRHDVTVEDIPNFDEQIE